MPMAEKTELTMHKMGIKNEKVISWSFGFILPPKLCRN